MKALRLMRRIRPVAVVGFGGYPTLPPLLAATLRRIPTVIHDANAVMGRANKMLAPRVRAIATSFPDMTLDPALAAKATFTGNPLRPEGDRGRGAALCDAAGRTVPPAGDRRQPGRAGDGRPCAAAVERIAADLRARLDIVQQARGEDESASPKPMRGSA
jgi:UDP-N-acetylglucosamine--N-acetylmuramyl-(pentapeptide) pyrophosphoryl-undecaprenol N-acetylglucosamine transferase